MFESPGVYMHEIDVTNDVMNDVTSDAHLSAAIVPHIQTMNTNLTQGRKRLQMLVMEGGIYGLQMIKNTDLEDLHELGSGTFGTVYYGKWRGTDVAIKRIKNSCFSGGSSEQARQRKDIISSLLTDGNYLHRSLDRRKRMMITLEAASEKELDLDKGDYVVVRKVSQSGWAEGECKGKAGWFPMACIEKRQRLPTNNIAAEVY